MWVKAASIFITLILIYLAILFGSFSPITLLLLAMFLGISKAMLALNVGHDANHHTFSRHKRVNSILSKSFDLLGSNSYIWDIVHNKVHHTYTNIFHYDTDTDIAPGILRLSPNEKWKPIYRYQHYYGYFLYFFTAFLRVFRLDFNKFLQKDIGPFKNIKHPTKEIVNLLLFKTLYFSIFLVIPYLIIEVKLWQFLIGFFVMMFTEGLLLGTTFQLAHLVNNADFPEPDENNTIASCWAVHQMATTANFCTKNWFITNFTGGLNHQIEHHLFPDYSSIHCTKIAPIVRAIAEEHGVKYQENISLWSALKSHFLFLKKLGTRPIVS
jgi:linoleoyl-CoA desaturase